jgi:DNA-binding MarR family transcriptional regulator
MQQFSNKEIAELKSRVDQIHQLLANRGDEVGVNELHGEAMDRLQAHRPNPLVHHLMYSIQIQKLRKAHFTEMDMNGACWDMMLDLMLAERSGRELSASDLATGAAVPLSSGLRMIASLENVGLVLRYLDQRDRRRTLVCMTDLGRTKMVSFFEKSDAAWSQNVRTAGAV